MMEAARMYSGELLPQINAVILHKMDGTKFELNGGSTGITMNVDSPWATQAMLPGIWENIGWHRYQPFTLEQAIMNPAVEIGDIVTHNGITERIYTMNIKFGKRVTATLGAPDWNECPHDYQPSVSGGGGGGSCGKGRTDNENIRFAREQLTADIGDVQAGLYAIAEADDIREFKRANTTLFAKLNGECVKKASISLEVIEKDGHQKSLATILADQITMQGKVSILDTFSVSGGNAVTVNGSFMANSIATSGQLSGRTLVVDSQEYVKKPVTFANGTFNILAV